MSASAPAGRSRGKMKADGRAGARKRAASSSRRPQAIGAAQGASGSKATRPTQTGDLEVRAVWHRLPCSQLELEQAARDVVQTLLAERQRRVDAPELIGTRAASRGGTAQSPETLSYVLAEERIVGLESGDPAGRTLRLRLSGGATLEVKTPARAGARSRLDGMSSELPKPRRRPAGVKIRPANRRAKPRLDPALGLDELLGVVDWQPASAGAWVAVIKRDPEGNTIGCGRLSGEDRNETMVTQVEGLLDLEERSAELTYRYLVLAVDMSGKRLVRPDPFLPPPRGTAERDDMVIVDQFIQEGWVEHLAFWSVDRIARKVLPAHVLYDRWEANDLGLWLVVNGGQIDYQDDDLLLGVLTMTSSNERKSIVRRTRGGLLRKGPLAGRGHLNSCPTFFRRDELGNVEEDPAVWKYCLRMFELADLGLGTTASVGASMREIAAKLAEEGFEIDHDRVRVLLDDIVYSTGEWKVRVSGIEIPQTPIQLNNPVPIDRAQRIQDWLRMRKGGSKNTQLGEVLFNYVETVHRQCEGETGGPKGEKVRIRGYRDPHIKREKLMLRHKSFVPECCKGKGRGKAGGWTWPVDEFARAAVLKVREIASHPEMLRQLALATRHAIADTSTRLTAEERHELEQQLEALLQQREAAADVWIQEKGGEGTPDFDDFQLAVRGFNRRIRALECRLENDEALALAQEREGGGEGPEDKRLEDFLEIMTLDTPTDPRMMALRARLFSLVVSKVIIDDDGVGPITLILESPLVPSDSPVELASPLHVAADLLDSYRREKEGRTSREDRVLQHAETVKTDFESSHSKSVFTLLPELRQLPTGAELERMRRDSLNASNWHHRPSKPEGAVVWRASVSISTEGILASATLTKAEQVVLSVIRPQTIFSSLEVLDAAEGAGVERSELRTGMSALERRGWLERVSVDGVKVWTLSSDFTHYPTSQDPRPVNERPAREARSRSSRASDSPPVPEGQVRHTERKVLLEAAALADSLAVGDALALSGDTSSGLLAKVRANELVACVFPSGEVRFPRWQWNGRGTVRPEVETIIAVAKEHQLGSYMLHRLMTRPRGRAHMPSFSTLLAKEGMSVGDSESTLHSITAAIVHTAGLSHSAFRRRRTAAPA